MSDISVSYEEMLAGATKLDQGRTNIEEQLDQQWNSGAKKVIAGLEGMSAFLTKAVQGHRDLDSGLSSGLS